MHTWIHPHHSTQFLSDYKIYTLFIHPITQNEDILTSLTQ